MAEAAWNWRGLHVDYATATPDIVAAGIDLTECVVVVDVQLDSPTWKAGLRPGMFIRTLADQVVRSPKVFLEVALSIESEAKIQAVSSDGVSNLIVGPEPR